MANKRKLTEQHENILKRGKQIIDDMVKNGGYVKNQTNKIIGMRNDKQNLSNDLVLKDRGMDMLNKEDIANIKLDRLVSSKDEGPSNLSWLVNLSAASLFNDAQSKQSASPHAHNLTYVYTWLLQMAVFLKNWSKRNVWMAVHYIVLDRTSVAGNLYEKGLNVWGVVWDKDSGMTVTGEQPISYAASLKPGLTYTELIEKALKEHGELTVSEIYKWIYSHYPYYKKNDGRWKNSIRHNLSINPQFRKGLKCNNGGHFWTLNKEYDEQFKKWQENKKSIRVDKRKKSILPKAEEDEIEIATRSIMLHEENSSDSICFHSVSDPSLVRAATDILSGVDKHVEVEYMNRIDCASAPLVIEQDIMECSDPMLADPLLFSDCLELGFQPYELIDSRL